MSGLWPLACCAKRDDFNLGKGHGVTLICTPFPEFKSLQACIQDFLL
jgi:hypothetical protein